MKILLVAINAKYIHASLGLRYLKANMPTLELKAATSIREFTIKETPQTIVNALSPSTKIVGIGVYIWNRNYLPAILHALKEARPDVTIVLGGPELQDSECDDFVADYLVHGEADFAFGELCQQILASTDTDKDGHRQDEKKEKTIIRAGQISDLSRLQFPYDLYDEDDLKHRLLYVESSRGCAFGCEFCLSAQVRIRPFPLVTFLQELQKLWDRGARTFKFIDRTFNAHVERGLAVLDFFLAKESPYFVHAEMVPEHFPLPLKERVKLFPPASLQLEIGVQTLHEEVAKRIGRRMQKEKMRENIMFLSEQTKVHLHTDLIIGLPGENEESFARGFDELLSWGPQEIQIGILKRLPGALIARHDDEYKMQYRANAPYDLLANRDLSAQKMEELKILAKLFDLFINSGRFAETVAELRRQEQLNFAFLQALTRFWILGAYPTHSLSLKRKGELFSHFLNDKKWGELIAKDLARFGVKYSVESAASRLSKRQGCFKINS